MKLTAIKPAAKIPGRYLIFVDNEYSFSLSESALLESKLAAGQELSSHDISRFKQLSSDDKLFNRALALVAARTKTSWEVEVYLARKGASDKLIDNIIAKLTRIGLIDDEKYVQSFISNRKGLRPTSKRKLNAELRKKHISTSLIDQALSSYGTDNDALEAVISQKMKQAKYHDKLKLMQYLARQGFAYDDIKSALSLVDFNED
jgi:regulatory protein